MAVRTRNKSSSRLSDYLGTGRELLVSDLPTTRDILRFGLLKREEYHLYKRNFTVDMLCDEMRDGLISQWQSANGLFQYPVVILRSLGIVFPDVDLDWFVLVLTFCFLCFSWSFKSLVII